MKCCECGLRALEYGILVGVAVQVSISKHFTRVTYSCIKIIYCSKVRVFVPRKLFQPSQCLGVSTEPTRMRHLSGAPLYG